MWNIIWILVCEVLRFFIFIVFIIPSIEWVRDLFPFVTRTVCVPLDEFRYLKQEVLDLKKELAEIKKRKFKYML